jgi:hypothetical protein
MTAAADSIPVGVYSLEVSSHVTPPAFPPLQGEESLSGGVFDETIAIREAR